MIRVAPNYFFGCPKMSDMDVIGGTFEVLRKLGQGGFGVVAGVEVDETAHLLRSEANRERIQRELADMEAGRNLVTVPVAQIE
jgi:hypothetical protein